MKKIYLIVLLFSAFYSMAQVGIGTTTPDASSALDLTSTTQGFLPPRMTATERDNIVSSATGLVIYNTTTNTLEYKTASGWVSYKDMPDGTAVGAMNYWDGTNWVTIAPGANGEVLKFVNNAPAWGMVEATVPDAPTIVSAVAGTGQAIITFNAPTFNGYSTITSYTATASPGGFTGSVSQSSSGSITVTSLTNGTSYTFSVTATNAIGTSVASAESEAVIPATVPDAPTITSVVAGNGQATISFNAPDFNGYSTITSYTATSSPGGFTGSVTQSDSGTIIVGSLTSGTSYTFTVTATNALGTSVVSNVSEAVIPATVPDAPTITSVVSGSGQATITFTAPANNGGSTITSYTATSSPGGHTGNVSQSGDGSITVIGLTNYTNYIFTVIANNIFGESSPSDPSESVTPSGFPVLGATTISNIGWVAATANGSVSNDTGNELIAKGVCWSTNQNPSISDSKTIESGSTGNFTSYITGLSPSTTYYVKPYATTAYGTVYGAEISFTTTATKTIGDSHEGGIIAYILTASDSGYASNYPHGIIAHTTDISTGIIWGCHGTLISGTFSSLIGYGLQNTINIVNECNTPANAAMLCYDFTFGGFDDWYLPSRTELAKLYANIGPGGTNIGGFSTSGQYWASEQQSATAAFKINFSNGNTSNLSKNSLLYVRPVRSF
jgi:hypothetical protein